MEQELLIQIIFYGSQSLLTNGEEPSPVASLTVSLLRVLAQVCCKTLVKTFKLLLQSISTDGEIRQCQQ
jgi:hypothetical protein